MKRWSFALAGIAIVAALALVFVPRDADETPVAEAHADEAVQPEPVRGETAAVTDDSVPPPSPPNARNIEIIKGGADLDSETVSRLLTIQSRRGEPISAEQWRAAESAPAWAPRDQPAAGLPLEPDEVDDGRTFIDFNRLRMDSVRAGDRMQVDIPQLARSYTVAIDEVREHADGIATWRGHLEDLPPHYTASITQGQGSTHGGISTPEGHFTIEAHGDSGWIVSTDTISQYDPDEPHAPIPPELEREAREAQEAGEEPPML